MLHQQLASLDAEPLDGGLRWLVPALVAIAAASGGALFWVVGEPMFAGLFLAGCVAMLVAAFIIDRRSVRAPAIATVAVPDFSLVGASLELVADAAALTRSDGSLVTINRAYRARFEDAPPLDLGDGDEHRETIAECRLSAWRDGSARLGEVETIGGRVAVAVDRAGSSGDLLLWSIAGTWAVSDTATISCSGSFGSGSNTETATGNITISQNGCNISFVSPANTLRSGTINSNNAIQVSGAVALASAGVTFTQNRIDFTGTLASSGRRIDLTGSGGATGSSQGVPGSCTASSTEVLTR